MYFKEQMLLAKKDEAEIDFNNKENDFLLAGMPNEEELEELNASCIMKVRIQTVNNDSDVGPSYDSNFANEVHGSQTRFIDDIFEKGDHEQCYREQTESIKPTYDDQIDSNIIFDDPDLEGNSENDEQDNNVHDEKYVEFESLIRNVQLEDEKTNKVNKAVKEENDLLKTKLEKYKERVRVFENKPENKYDYMQAYNEALNRENKLKDQLQRQFLLEK
ncbi:hypothetical protein Tco_0596007 [Tanacetum coccineum]